MIAAMAQWEREEISSRVAASVPVRAKMGRSTGGKPVYGYHWVDSKMVPQPEEAAVRKLMVSLFLEHRRKLTVARILNERGYRTRAGNLWSYSTVGKLLQDPTVKGNRLANFTRNLGDGKWEFKPKEEWVNVPVEPIVSEEDWNECNRILNEGREGHGRYMQKGRNPKYLFSGLAFCGACGNDVKMYPQTGTPKYRCYKCSNKIPKDDLEALFIEQMSDFLLDDRRLAEYMLKASEAAGEKRSLLQSLAKDGEKVSKRLESLVDLYQGGALGFDEFKRQSVPLEARKIEIARETEHLKEMLMVLDAEQVSSQSLAKDGAKLVSQWFKMSHLKQRELVENLVSRVTINRSEIDFDLRYLPGMGKKHPHSHLFNYAKNHDPAWPDPNEELMPER
ncbi:recombinase family protein [Luteolibacter yonseiensis]|uniref:Recombinase family protein n=1 Tax=Luteolibacter yonseiensis TaxID=1144680 RepID=A0A934R8D1_9BACT|nr:recombinase family protein [Luteolibacter yonseiensis]MBK1818192.1 recombinase family protein [Luteolibacter yonseiensis]